MDTYDINIVYDRYKEWIKDASALEDTVEKIINKRQLSSFMSDAKWLKLQTAILSTPDFEPAYSVQLLTDDVKHSPKFEKIPSYLGSWELIYENWEYAPPCFINIEWMSIQPLYSINRGRLVDPEIIDKSDVLLDILHKCNIPFEKEDEHTFVIYGYK